MARAVWARIEGEHEDTVAWLQRHLALGSEDSEDVWQDTVIRAFQCIRKFDARRGSFRSWIRRIAYRRAWRFVRRERERLGRLREWAFRRFVGGGTPRRNDLPMRSRCRSS